MKTNICEHKTNICEVHSVKLSWIQIYGEKETSVNTKFSDLNPIFSCKSTSLTFITYTNFIRTPIFPLLVIWDKRQLSWHLDQFLSCTVTSILQNIFFYFVVTQRKSNAQCWQLLLTQYCQAAKALWQGTGSQWPY